jgi:hypothetical protein
MLEIQKRKFDPIPKGLYIAKITEVDEEKKNIFKKKPEDPDFNVGYTLEIVSDEDGSEEFAGRKLWLTYHPASIANLEIYNLATKKDVTLDDEAVKIDIQEAVGKLVRLTVKVGAKKDGTPNNTIESIMALPKSYTTEQPTVPENTVPSDEEVEEAFGSPKVD